MYRAFYQYPLTTCYRLLNRWRGFFYLVLHVFALLAFPTVSMAQGYEYNYWHDNIPHVHFKWEQEKTVPDWNFQLINYLTANDTLRDRDPFAYSRGVNHISSISDTAGNLLFYTDGDTVYDNRGNRILFGNLNNPAFGIGRSFFIRMPGQFRFYYLFQQHWNQFGQSRFAGLVYSVIDRNHFSGQPAVVVKNKPVYGIDRSRQHMTFHAHYGANQDTVYIHLIVDGSDSIYTYHLTRSGLAINRSERTKTDSFRIGIIVGGTRMKTTTNGSLSLYITSRNRSIILEQDYLLSDKSVINAEFSPDGRFLYCIIQDTTDFKLIQYDLIERNISNRYDSIVLYQGITGLFNQSNMILGPDHKIYFCGRYEINVIEFPKQKGKRCKVVFSKYKTKNVLGYRYGINTLPYIPEKKPLLEYVNSLCQSREDIVRSWTGYHDSSYLFINNEKYFSDSNTFLIKPLSYGKLPVSVHYKANDTWLTFTDTIFVKENKRISISGNPIICGSTPARLSVSDSFANFKWSNGDSTKNIAVSRPFKAFVFIPDSVCAHSDTVEVFKVSRKNYIEQSRAGICERDSVVISLSPSSNLAFITVGADSTRNVTFHKPGNYVLNIHDSGCTFQDSISIFLHPRHRSFLYSNILACKDSLLTVSSLVSGAVWQWQGKQTTADTFQFIPDQSGKLVLNTWLTCPQADTVAVEVRYCQRPKITFFIPTAFSPDANGLNDIYLPTIQEMQLEKMTVFNRWGQKIYEGNTGWDGNFNQEKCPEGVYVVSLIYRHMYAPEEPLLIIRANVTLIR